MTEAEKVTNARDIAGNRGYAGLLALLNATDEEYMQLAESINNAAGAAERMAAIRLDNLQGQVTLLQSAWDANKTTIGEALIPSLTRLAETATTVLTKTNEFLAKNPELIELMASLAAGIGGVVSALAAAKIAVVGFNAVAKVLSGPVGWITLAAGAVTGLGIAAWSAAKDAETAADKYNEEIKKISKSTIALQAETADSVENALAASNTVEKYISTLETLDRKTELTTTEQQRYKDTLSLIAETVPELSQYIDTQNGKLLVSTETLRENARAWRDNAFAQAFQNQSAEAIQQLAQATVTRTKAEIGLEDAIAEGNRLAAERAAIQAHINSVMSKATNAAELEAAVLTTDSYNRLLEENTDKIYANEKEQEKYRKAISSADDEITAVNNILEATNRAIEKYSSNAVTAADGTAELAEENEAVVGILNEAQMRIEKIQTAYDDAYEAAYKSVSGQYQLWDSVDEAIATSADTIAENLEKQVSYWSDYNSNLDTLLSRTGEINGLKDLIASFADGSPESVNAIAGLATATDEELGKIVEAWQKNQQVQDEISKSIADAHVDVKAEMDSIVKTIADDVNKLDLSSEAAQAADKTMRAYIVALEPWLPTVTAMYSSIRSTASSPATDGDAYDYLRGGYASGTFNAIPGVKLVGENGPEIEVFNGGEKIINAIETRKILNNEAVSAATAPVNVNVSFNIEGNANNDTVRLMNEQGKDFANRVLSVVKNAMRDAERRSYR